MSRIRFSFRRGEMPLDMRAIFGSGAGQHAIETTQVGIFSGGSSVRHTTSGEAVIYRRIEDLSHATAINHWTGDVADIPPEGLLAIRPHRHR